MSGLLLGGAVSLAMSAVDVEEVPKPPSPNAIRVEAISLVGLRLSAEYERRLAPHHALVFGAFVQATGWVIPLGDAMACIGGAVSYRFYSRPEMTGFFVAPGFMAGRYYSADTLSIGDLLKLDLSPKEGKFFSSFAPTLDIGYQHRFRNGGLVGIAVGTQFNFATRHDMSDIAYWFAGNGLRPRIMLEVGSTF